MKIGPSILDSLGIEEQENLIIKMNHERNLKFNTLVKDWEAEQEKVCLSANSQDYISGEAYASLVAMGPCVIPNIMAIYAAQHDEPMCNWWFKLLHDIVVPERSHGSMFMVTVKYAGWSAWVADGADFERVPAGL